MHPHAMAAPFAPQSQFMGVPPPRPPAGPPPLTPTPEKPRVLKTAVPASAAPAFAASKEEEQEKLRIKSERRQLVKAEKRRLAAEKRLLKERKKERDLLLEQEGQLLESVYDEVQEGPFGRELMGYMVPINCENSGARCLPATHEERAYIRNLKDGGVLHVKSDGHGVLAQDLPIE